MPKEQPEKCASYPTDYQLHPFTSRWCMPWLIIFSHIAVGLEVPDIFIGGGPDNCALTLEC